MRLLRITVGAVLMTAATFGSVGSAVAQSDDIPNMNMRWGHFAPPAWGSAQAEQLFADEVERLTDGKVKMQIFWSGAIGAFGELMQLTASGAIDVGSVVPTYHPSEWPMMGPINSLPLTWDDPVQAMEIQEYLVEQNQAIRDELDKNNMVPIILHGLPPYRLQCTEPVRTLDDLRGKRIRTFGEWPPYVFEQLGAIPVNVPLGEVYEGLQRGSLDCGYNPNENAGFLRLYEVAKYWSDINLGAIAAYSTFMSKDKYEALPVSLKDIFRRAAAEAEAFEKQNFKKLEQEHLEKAKEAGVEYIEFQEQDKLNAMFPDMLTRWQEQTCERLPDQCDGAKSVVKDMRTIMRAYN